MTKAEALAQARDMRENAADLVRAINGGDTAHAAWLADQIQLQAATVEFDYLEGK